MGHYIVGIIGRRAVIEMFARGKNLHAPVPLQQDLVLLGLRDSDLDAMVGPVFGNRQAMEETRCLAYLVEPLAELLRVQSLAGSLIYLETAYFGGEGSQGAAAWSGGSLVFGPEVEHFDVRRNSLSDGPINRALAVLGVHASGTQDAFDLVGLGRYRHREDIAPEED